MYEFPSNPNFTFFESSKLPYTSYEKDVVSVLESVKLLFSKYFDNVDANALAVINVYPSDDYPMVVYERNIIYLSVPAVNESGDPNCDWARFIYQFSHEFCHYMSFGHVPKRMRWFEESICEMASHFFLIESEKSWRSSPPYPNWSSYASSIAEYESKTCNGQQVINLSDLSNFRSPLLESLQNNEYQRQINRYIALQMLPIFQNSPSLWKIVPYLVDLSNNKSFSDNLKELEKLSGQDISSIFSLFSVQR